MKEDEVGTALATITKVAYLEGHYKGIIHMLGLLEAVIKMKEEFSKEDVEKFIRVTFHTLESHPSLTVSSDTPD